MSSNRKQRLTCLEGRGGSEDEGLPRVPPELTDRQLVQSHMHYDYLEHKTELWTAFGFDHCPTLEEMERLSDLEFYSGWSKLEIVAAVM